MLPIFVFGERLFEALQTSIQRLIKAAFFILQRLPHDILPALQFRENAAHLLNQRLNQSTEEWLVAGEAKLTTVADGAAQDTA